MEKKVPLKQFPGASTTSSFYNEYRNLLIWLVHHQINFLFLHLSASMFLPLNKIGTKTWSPGKS